MKPKVYVETTVVSYLTAWPDPRRPSTDYSGGGPNVDCLSYTSQLVLREAQAGDDDKARRRLRALGEVEMLEVTEDTLALAEDLVSKGACPEKRGRCPTYCGSRRQRPCLPDHLELQAIATRMRDKIEQVCRAKGHEPVVICTPEELLEE